MHTETGKPFELSHPDDETQALLDQIARTPSLTPSDPRYVRFYMRSKRNAEKSAKEGRPIFEPREYVEILCPGDKDTIIDRPVRKLDRYVWREKYLAFKRNETQETPGTPLTEWEGVTPERAKELEYFRIRTVEQLADVPDSNLGNLGHTARAERDKAKGYLEVMRGNAPMAQLRDENAQLKARLEALERLAQSDTKPKK
jgi:hypothetical protein